MTTPVLLQPVGRVSVVAARFRPGATYPLLGFAQDELAGAFLDARDAWPRLPVDVIARLAAARPAAARARVLDDTLVTLLPGTRPDPRVDAAVSLVFASRGAAPVARLAAAAELGPRQLERIFRRTVGLTPKALCRIARFQSVFRLARAGACAQTALALETGYYDHAHFIHDFKRFMGMTPAAYFAAAPELSSYFTAGGGWAQSPSGRHRTPNPASVSE
jgi:methylphosphotriester-DNA--protein-cysteine methyltransferase